MPDEVRPEVQFATLAQEREVATLGIWIFLATEVLFFGGMLGAYATYRFLYSDGFAAAGQHTKIVIGSVNTAVLLTSSLFMALAVRAAKLDDWRWVTRWLLLTGALGLVFMALKGLEYYEEYDEHLVPGLNFVFAEPHAHAAELFYWIYFALTGVHALHLTIGLGVVATMIALTRRGRFNRAYHTPLEVAGLYWHFVDIVWIFLYPLIYLVGRAS
jgi:cytochrome c oxidase subunit III